jgi:hypothetical protein
VAKLLSTLRQEGGASPAQVRGTLAELVRRRLVLEIDGRAVSLVLKDPVPEYPPPSSNPCGFFLPEEFQKDDLRLA